MNNLEQLKVSVNDNDNVSALLYSADKKERVGTTIILGHGAGAGQLTPFMRLFANGLSSRGFDVLTFNFHYMDQGRKVPDRNDKLELCYRAVIDGAATHKKLKGNRIVIGGKSMGGRIASQVAADFANHPNAEDTSGGIPDTWLRPALTGLVFLGYPLHPPGKPEKMRDAHLKDIKAPMLFIQGSRDAFGTADEIRSLIKRLKLPAMLNEIESGDHSLKVPRSGGVPQTVIYEDSLDQISNWLRSY